MTIMHSCRAGMPVTVDRVSMQTINAARNISEPTVRSCAYTSEHAWCRGMPCDLDLKRLGLRRS